MASQSTVRLRIRVEGTVQGVGFRPFVYGLATRDGLAGLVGNDADGVFIEVEGVPAQLDRFRAALRAEAPPLAHIHRVTADPIAAVGGSGFRIAPSAPDGNRRTQVPADAATCADCLRELADPADRRYRYPFINCTNCGPRFTIVRDIPYDRRNTTMADFALCPRCEAEYHDPGDRRFHAQPVCCPDCGPTLRLLNQSGVPIRTPTGDAMSDPIGATAALLREGKVVAIKGLGGYHLAASAVSAEATALLRARKHRDVKPFAVMVADLAAARRLGRVGPVEAELLTDASRPIVLLPRSPEDPVAPPVAPGNPYLGVLLPYSALHVLLLAEFGDPLVLTSANLSDEPIAYRDDEAVARLAGIADGYLTHDRPIHVRTDDSVVRVVRDRPLMLRRSRGFVPGPIRLPRSARRPTLGCGAELKNTFCLATLDTAVVSQHIGDLGDYETYRSYVEAIGHLQQLFGITPEIVAYDLHPEYLSARYALDLPDVELIGVQHHHAHIAACLVDNAEPGPVIGVAFDGLGYGTDATLWGGEFLAADLAQSTRLGHLAPVAMPGGDAAVRQPWRMAAAYLDAAGLSSHPALVEPDRWRDVLAVSRVSTLSPRTSSAGRLFDAISALVTGRTVAGYEGQAAIELEHLAEPDETGCYPARLRDGSPFEIVGADLVTAVVSDLDSCVPPARVSMRVHRAVAALVADGCELARQRTGLSTVALSGGVFQNVLLLGLGADALRQRGFRVLTHQRIAPNDSGISLGQVAIAAARS
jgi:hydrogenase maturation protein HypF